MGQLTLAKIAKHLADKKLIDSEQQILSSTKPESTTPWYIYGLITIAAWFSTIFFLIFFFMVLFSHPEEAALVTGILLCIIAVLLNSNKAKDSIFLSQVSLAFNIAGQTLIVVGFASTYRSFDTIAISIIIIFMQLIMSFFYRHPVQYFAAPIAIAYALFFLLLDIEGTSAIRYFESSYSVHVLVALLTAATGYLWYKESFFLKYPLFHYLLFGITSSLLSIVSISVMAELRNQVIGQIQYYEMWWISGIILGLALLFLEMQLLGDLIKTNMGIAIVAASFLFCLITINSPGLIATIFTLTLGFYRGNKLLMLLSFLSFAGFLFFFYYSLNMTLLNKSLVLMASGILLLILSAVVNRPKLEVKNA